MIVSTCVIPYLSLASEQQSLNVPWAWMTWWLAKLGCMVYTQCASITSTHNITPEKYIHKPIRPDVRTIILSIQFPVYAHK